MGAASHQIREIKQQSKPYSASSPLGNLFTPFGGNLEQSKLSKQQASMPDLWLSKWAPHVNKRPFLSMSFHYSLIAPFREFLLPNFSHLVLVGTFNDNAKGRHPNGWQMGKHRHHPVRRVTGSGGKAGGGRPWLDQQMTSFSWWIMGKSQCQERPGGPGGGGEGTQEAWANGYLPTGTETLHFVSS